jgi:4-amino-4-deoxy-L-arabinose transferase-like glycosyltransferase
MYLRFIRSLAVVALLVGVAARIADFGATPPGLNQDEASIGYEAWSLLHYGIDRNGQSWPVHLISWGSGQNVLYAYMAMPFVAFGLSPVTVRLPMLLSGLLSLPLVWFLAQRLFGEKAAWGAASAVALSPWHVMLSRWGLESNLLPFVFLCAIACFVKSQDTDRPASWLIAACALFGLSLYSYGTAYVAVPAFLLLALWTGIVSGAVTVRRALVGLGVFAIVATPIALFVLLNAFKGEAMSPGGLTIPRLPGAPRFQTQVSGGLIVHAGQLWQLLLSQSDGTVYNVTDPYGVLYSSVFFALAAGLAVTIVVMVLRARWPARRMLLPLWIIAALPTGLLQQPNINRINLLLMGLVVAAGMALAVMDGRMRGVLVLGLIVLLALFPLFARDYFGVQRTRVAQQFFDGLLPALDEARLRTGAGEQICVTRAVKQPDIYALFSEQTDPHAFLDSVQYADATARFRQVNTFGRYVFGLQRCDFGRASAVIARRDEHVPAPFARTESFGLFALYLKR